MPTISSLPTGIGGGSPARVEQSNVFVSTNGSFRNLTPMSRALYSFGESPATDLAIINRSVNAPTSSSLLIPNLNDDLR